MKEIIKRKIIAINDAKAQRAKRMHHFTNPVEKAQHGKLVALVDNMLELQKKYHGAENGAR